MNFGSGGGRVNYRILYFFHGQNIALPCARLDEGTRIFPRSTSNMRSQERNAYEQNPFPAPAPPLAVPKNADDI